MAELVRANALSLDDLLQFLKQAVAERSRSTGAAVSGAYLADAIRQRFPGFSYEQVGLTRLSEAVAIAEERGLVARNRSVKHLEVMPKDAPATAQFDSLRDQSLLPHIRPDIWRAFVYISQAGECFYDRQSGVIVNASDVRGAQDEGRFARVDPIPLKVQQEWMREFVKDKPQVPAHEAPIHDQYCFVKFPVWLRDREPALEKAWKEHRVRRVVDYVREWAKNNSIDANAFFSLPAFRTSGRPTARPISRDEEVIRSAVTLAARELPVELLQDIAVPIRYVLRALQQSR